MVAPVHRLTAKEIRALALGRCRHGHSFLEHYQCFLDENPWEQPKIGFLDIESSNLEANFGICLTWSILDGFDNRIISAAITKKDINTYAADKSDTRIVRELVETIRSFDTIVTFYGKRFDIPFMRTRALIDGVEFPVWGTLHHIDVYDWAKHKLRLQRNGQESVCRALFGETEKTHLEYKYWIDAARGGKESIDYILEHNYADVRDLKRIYEKLQDFAKRNDSSI